MSGWSEPRTMKVVFSSLNRSGEFGAFITAPLRDSGVAPLRRKSHSAVMKPLLIVALATFAAPAAGAAPYRAVGTEPFWSLTIDNHITYDPASGRTIRARTPKPQIGIAGDTYRTPF